MKQYLFPSTLPPCQCVCVALQVVTGTPATSRPLDAFLACDALTFGQVFGVTSSSPPLAAQTATSSSSSSSSSPSSWALEQGWQLRRATFKRHNCYSHVDKRDPQKPLPVRVCWLLKLFLETLRKDDCNCERGC